MVSPVSISQQEFAEVLQRLEQWPPTDRWTLTQRLLDGLGREQTASRQPPRTIPLDQIRGMLKTAGPPPTDEQVKQWIEEERLKKYG